jgi:signal transduction histidine kinase
VRAPRSLRTRLTLAFALMALVAVGGSFSGLAILVEHAVWAPLDAGLEEEADSLVKLIDLPLDRLAETVHEFGAETDLGSGKFVRVVGPTGHTIAHWRNVPPKVGRRRPTPLTQLTTLTVGGGSRAYRVVWAPTPVGGWVVVGVRVAGQARLVRQARLAIGGVGIALVVLLIAVAWGVTSRAVTELGRLANELETIQAGSLERRLTPRDTTEVDRLVHVLNRMLARLEAAVGHLRRFTADAAHELRTPIAAVRAHLDVTLGRARTVDEFRDGVVDSIDQAERLGRLADDLLTLSMVETSGPGVLSRSEAVRLDLLVREVAEFLEPVAEEQARPFTCDTNGPVTVRGVPSLLKRVVLNLVDNAFRHTSGAVRVRLATDDDGSARVDVSDDGTGIPPDVLPHVFERFRRGASDGSGSGLGMALVREIVSAHGGRVDLTSGASGTTVSVVVPLDHG